MLTQEKSNVSDELTDRDLVSLARQGQSEAFNYLIKRYLRLSYRVAAKYIDSQDEREDVVQESFIKVWRNLKTYDPEKKFSNWLYEITKNTSLDYLKKKKAVPFSVFENTEGQNDLLNRLADPRAGVAEQTDKIMNGEKIRFGLSRLSLKYQEAIDLHDLKEFSFQEIADGKNQSLNTIKSRYRRGIQKLREILK